MAKTFCVPEVGSQQRADHGSGIDGSVEPGEIVAQLSLLLWQLELLSSKRGHTRLDATSADCDEEQTDE